MAGSVHLANNSSGGTKQPIYASVAFILGFISLGHGLLYALFGAWMPYLELTPLNRRSENIRVLSVVVTELKSRDVAARYLRLTLCKPPMMPRFHSDQKPAMA
jgi:hypothetical protein